MELNTYRKGAGPLHVILFVCLCGRVQAQDTLVFTDNRKVVCKVIEVGYEQIKYTLPPDTSVTLTCFPYDLKLIIYQNGKRDAFHPPIQIMPEKAKERLYHHDVALNLLPLVIVQLGLQYQLTLQKAGISLVFPVQFMLLKKPLNDGTEQLELGFKNYNIGTGIYFHGKRKNQFTYFGPLFRVINQNIKSSYWIKDYNGHAYQYIQECKATYYNVLLTLGHYSANRHRSMNTFMALGAQYAEYSNYMYVPFSDTKINPEYWSIWANVGICIGFGF